MSFRTKSGPWNRKGFAWKAVSQMSEAERKKVLGSYKAAKNARSSKMKTEYGTAQGARPTPLTREGEGVRRMTPREAKKDYKRLDGSPFNPEVQKSFLGGAYRKVTSLDRGERELLRRGGQMANQKAITRMENHDAHNSMKELRGAVASAKHWRAADYENEGIAGFAIRTGGKNTGKGHVFAPHNATRDTIVHETAHADAKRSAYRMHHQISTNPEKKMREEGRADYLASGHFMDLPKPKKNSDTTMSGYQDAAQLARAEQKSGRTSFRAEMTRAQIGRYVGGNTHEERIENGRKATNAYAYVQGRMKAAGTKVRKSMPEDKKAWHSIDQSERLAAGHRRKRRNSYQYAGGLTGLGVTAAATFPNETVQAAQNVKHLVKLSAQHKTMTKIPQGLVRVARGNPIGAATLGTLAAGAGFGASGVKHGIQAKTNQARADRRRKANYDRKRNAVAKAWKDQSPRTRATVMGAAGGAVTGSMGATIYGGPREGLYGAAGGALGGGALGNLMLRKPKKKPSTIYKGLKMSPFARSVTGIGEDWEPKTWKVGSTFRGRRPTATKLKSGVLSEHITRTETPGEQKFERFSRQGRQQNAFYQPKRTYTKTTTTLRDGTNGSGGQWKDTESTTQRGRIKPAGYATGAGALVTAGSATGFHQAHKNVSKSDIEMIRNAEGKFMGRRFVAPVMLDTAIHLDNEDIEDEIAKASSTELRAERDKYQKRGNRQVGGAAVAGPAGYLALTGMSGSANRLKAGVKRDHQTLKHFAAHGDVKGARKAWGYTRGAGRSLKFHSARNPLGAAMFAAGTASVPLMVAGVKNTGEAQRLDGQAKKQAKQERLSKALDRSQAATAGATAGGAGILGGMGLSYAALGRNLQAKKVGGGKGARMFRQAGKLQKAGNRTAAAGGAALLASGIGYGLTKPKQPVTKGMPDNADVHIEGVLRPLPKLKRVAKADRRYQEAGAGSAVAGFAAAGGGNALRHYGNERTARGRADLALNLAGINHTENERKVHNLSADSGSPFHAWENEMYGHAKRSYKDGASEARRVIRTGKRATKVGSHATKAGLGAAGLGAGLFAAGSLKDRKK